MTNEKNAKLEKIGSFLENLEPEGKLYFNTFFEKDQVARLQSIIGRVHIGMISAFRTSVETGFAGYEVAKRFMGSEITLGNEKEFLDNYVVNEGEAYSRKLNMARNDLLGGMIRSWKKVSFKAVTGGYKEYKNQKIEQERSFLLISRPDVSFEEFRNVLVGLGVLFGQDSVFIKEAGEVSNLVTTNYSSVLTEDGTEVDNGKYKIHISSDVIGKNVADPKFKKTLSKILSSIKDTEYAYSIFDKYGKRLDAPDRNSKEIVNGETKVKNRVFTGDVDFESVETKYDFDHWNLYVESGKPFGTLSEKYVCQSVTSFIDFRKVW